MLDRPQFKSCYAVATIAPDRIFLVSDRETICLRDRCLYLAASLIDGDRRSDDIIEVIQSQLLVTTADDRDDASLFQEALNIGIEAQSALFNLEQSGYIVEKSNLLSPNLINFCEQLNINTSQADRRLISTKIAIESFDSVAPDSLIANLQSVGIQIVDTSADDRVDLNIVLTDDYLHPNLVEFNRRSIQSQIPWMLVKPSGTIVWIGPIFDGDRTACWQCLARRLEDNRPVKNFIQTADRGLFPATLQTALGMVTTEVFKWIICGKNEQLTNTLITYDPLKLHSEEHAIVKRPQCPICGQMNPEIDRQPLPIRLGHRPKIITTNGGYRCSSPAETFRKYQHHLSPITGVVRELTKLSGNHLNHTYIAKHHFATSLPDRVQLGHNLEGRSAGKGRTDLQAKVSGFCEAIERYSGVFQGDEIRTIGSYQRMGDRAIHPNACMNFSHQQYQTRSEWNATCRGWFQQVPEPFDEERSIDWTPVWSLTDRDFKYLPTAYCYYGYPQIERLDCWADSNGCAAGNTIEEAILQGFLELVERDSIALWWYNRLQKPQVNLDSFDDPYFQSLHQYYQQLGREIWVLDITSDLNIPTFVAISRRIDRPIEDIIFGYGTHFDPQIALNRALTELNQILPSVVAANADGATAYPAAADPLAIEWWKTATLDNQSYLTPDRQIPLKISTDYPHIPSQDLLEDLKLCQQIVENQNMEMLVLDLTRPDIGLKVVKVIVPGMRHMWKRLGAGRLDRVPVKMGWLSTPLAESELNNFPMWM